MTKKQGAIFDMDGLLFETERLYRESWRTTARDFGFDRVEEFSRDMCGATGQRIKQVILSYAPHIDLRRFIDACVARVEAAVAQEVPEKPGIREILQYSRTQNCRMAIASSSRRHTIVCNLQSAGILQYFDAIVSGEDITDGKPHPEIYLRAAQTLGLSPQDCYAFEDSKNGIRAAHAAGCTPIMIPDLETPDEEMYRLCFAVCPSLTQAKQLLERHL